MTPDEIRARLQAHPEWFHTIELAPGLFTPGRCSQDALLEKWAVQGLTDLAGRSVLDIGAYDGYFSFAAERAGAARVVALDHYVGSADMAGYMAEWRASKAAGGTPLPAPHATRHWDPDGLPGRRPFDLARAAIGSRVIPVVGDFMTMDLEALGTFDVVLFFGVLYHLTDPLGAMRRVAQVTAPGGLVAIETDAIEIPGHENLAWWEFFPGQERNNDASNWWAPNAVALRGLCRAAGFREVTILTPPPALRGRAGLRAVERYIKYVFGFGSNRRRYRLSAQARL